MNSSRFPDHVHEAGAQILAHALVRIRSLGDAGDAHRCSVEADHVHNLPFVMTHNDIEGLRYYLEAEVPSYVAELARRWHVAPDSFVESHWKTIRAFLDQLTIR